MRFLLLQLVFLSSSVQGRGRAKELDLGSAFLRRGRGLGCGAGGRGRGALQGPQSLAEPRVLIGLNLSHQNSPLMLELLQKDSVINESMSRFITVSHRCALILYNSSLLTKAHMLLYVLLFYVIKLTVVICHSRDRKQTQEVDVHTGNFLLLLFSVCARDQPIRSSATCFS